jgi:hypothetical protein
MRSYMTPKAGVVALLALVLALPTRATAGEVATFDSFYAKDRTAAWVVGGLLGVASVAAVVYTGGGATPVVATWAGNMMGLSGAAATNAGLAMFGGGSIASGGLGMLGGTVVLGTGVAGAEFVVGDKIDGALASAEYKRYVENSRRLMNFPMPRNDSGSDNFDAAVEILDKADPNRPAADDRNKRFVWRAIDLLNESERDADLEERVRKQTLISILWFSLNEPANSAKHAEEALRLAHKAEVRDTMPALLVALGELCKDEPDYRRSLSLFERAISRENGSRFQPLAYMIYADRLMTTVAGRPRAAEMLEKLYRVQGGVEYRQERSLMHVALVNHHAWELERQKNRVVALTDGDMLGDVDPELLLSAVSNAVEQHRLIAREYDEIVRVRLARIRKETREESVFEKLWEKGRKNDWEARWANRLKPHEDKLVQVRRDQSALIFRYKTFEQQIQEASQSALDAAPADPTPEAASETGPDSKPAEEEGNTEPAGEQ